MDASSGVGKVVARVAGTSGFRRFAPSVLVPVDRFVHRVTGGRVLIAAALLPSLVLTTTGAKSGLPRQTPLATFPQDDGTFIVVGSNFGRTSHPAWTGNLLEEPEATIAYKGQAIGVTAHQLSDEEKAEIWPRLIQDWPTFDTYVATSGRNLRVFRLVPK
jgi:deazaflavin-dependent oxidoreductase (nitroreductase family)